MARVKPIFAKRFQTPRQAIKRRAGCGAGAGRHASGKPGRRCTQHHLAARESPWITHAVLLAHSTTCA
jgi:hypothetical protein